MARFVAVGAGRMAGASRSPSPTQAIASPWSTCASGRGRWAPCARRPSGGARELGALRSSARSMTRSSRPSPHGRLRQRRPCRASARRRGAVFEGVTETLEQARGIREDRPPLHRGRHPGLDHEQHSRDLDGGVRPAPGRFSMCTCSTGLPDPVVELSVHAGTDAAVVERCKRCWRRSAGAGGLRPGPGYIVPRLQALVMNEASRMIEEVPPRRKRSTRPRASAWACASPPSAGRVHRLARHDILHHASARWPRASTPALRAPDIVAAWRERPARRQDRHGF